MKTFKTLIIGGMVWFLGVLAYSLSFYLPILENVEQQANLTLFFAVVPLVWFGSWLYYRKGAQTHGLATGLVFFAMAALLDALITVPVLIIPNGGNYYDFFMDAGFWVIGAEFIGTAVMYWNFKVRQRTRELI